MQNAGLKFIHLAQRQIINTAVVFWGFSDSPFWSEDDYYNADNIDDNFDDDEDNDADDDTDNDDDDNDDVNNDDILSFYLLLTEH